MALQVVQQMQSQQNVQMNMMMSLVGQVQGQVQSGSAGAAPDAGGTPKDDGSSDFQGVRYCQRCGKNAYLREGVCFDMQYVPWEMFLKIRRLPPIGGGSLLVARGLCFFLFLLGQQISGPELQPSECPAVGRASPSLVWPLWAALCGQPESLEGQEEEQGAEEERLVGCCEGLPQPRWH